MLKVFPLCDYIYIVALLCVLILLTKSLIIIVMWWRVCVCVWDAARWNRKQWAGGASWCHEPIQEVPGHNNCDEDTSNWANLERLRAVHESINVDASSLCEKTNVTEMERAVTVVILSLVFLASQVSLRTLTTEIGLCVR